MTDWKKILILLEDKALKAEFEAELSAVLPSFSFSQDCSNLINTLIIIDEKNLSDDLIQKHASSILLITASDDNKNVTDYLLSNQINHIFGGNAKNLMREVRTTLIRMTSPSIWGPVHFLGDNADIVSTEIQHSDRIQEEVNKAVDHFQFKSFFETPADYIKVMSNELLTNAFYNISQTPVDRKDSISFDQDKKVLFQIALDKNYLAISIRDNSGTLGRDGIVKSIERGFREKTVQHKEGGAGIGLYLTFSHSNQMIVNQVPSIGTEVICVIDVNRRFKHYKERITSFHFHKEG